MHQPFNYASDALIYTSHCTVGGPGHLTGSHQHTLVDGNLILSCSPGWLRSTPCHIRRQGGCLLGVNRLIQDTPQASAGATRDTLSNYHHVYIVRNELHLYALV